MKLLVLCLLSMCFYLISFTQSDFTRGFKMGVAGLVPKNNDYSQDGFNDLFEKIPSYGELFGVHATHFNPAHSFTEDSIPTPFFLTFEAVEGVTQYAAIGLKAWEGMNQDDVDNYFQNHKAHFKHVVTTVAEDYEPEYLVIGIEVNHHIYRESASFWSDFVIAYKELYDEIKTNHPTIKIGTNFFIEDMKGLLVAFPESNWELIEEFEGKSDFISFTTFPFVVFNHPDEIPENYYAEINDYVQLPVLITETGWPTEPVTMPNLPDLSADEETQVEYIKTLVNRTCLIDNFEALVWAFPHDGTFSTQSDLFNNISLRRLDGTEKPGFELWSDMLQFPIDDGNTVCDGNLNIEEVERADLSIFPNPSSGTFTVSSEELISTVVVYNTQGGLVYSEYNASFFKHTFSLKQPGIYHVQITTKSGTINRKIAVV